MSDIRVEPATPSNNPSGIQTTRRSLLQMMLAAPVIPISSSFAASALLTGCGGSSGSSSADYTTTTTLPTYKSVTFKSMAAPTLANPAEMATTLVKSTMDIDYVNGTKITYSLAYEPFFITGTQVPDGKGGTILAGGYYNINNQPIIDNSVPSNARQFFSDAPDGSSLIKLPNASVSGVKGNPVFAVVQFEYTSQAQDEKTSMYGVLPSPIAVLTLDQDPATGKLTLVKYHNVDTSSVNGLWITCGASLSPWNTHLSSEEYEPDATRGQTAQMKAYSQNLYGDPNKANPYHYGHLPEVTVNPDGTGSIKKHYCLGRISHELVQVMPDKRTVIMGDDATNGGAFMFIADREADLSSGTLYAGIVTQRANPADARTGEFDLKWIKLGSATSAEIRALVDGGIKSTDIMDVKTRDPNDPSYTKIPFSGGFNWVKLMPGMEKAAAFLETHRYAALKGASLGFTKWEGTTVNVKDKIAYIAMASIGKSMKDGSGGFKVAGVNAGAVYAQNLRSGQVDTAGMPINSEWVPVDMIAPPALIGEDLGTQDALGNLANPDKLGNPDNLKFSEGMRTLFIGEDSGLHVNNFLWAYNVDTKTLTRLLSCPAGAESTGLHAVDTINGFTYIMSNFQHAGDWESPLHDKVKATLDPLIRANYNNRFGAAVGYLTGFPRMAV